MNKIVWLLLGLGAAAGATTVHLVAELRAERENSRKLQARVAELERRQAQVAAPHSGPERQVESAPATELAAPSDKSPASAPKTFGVIVPGPAATAPVDPRSSMRAHFDRRRQLLRDPEYREAMRAQQKAMMPHQYPDLAAELGLTPEQTDRFTSLLADQQIRSMELFDIAPPAPGQPQEEAVMEARREKIQQWQQNAQAELKAELGDEKYRAWQEYQSTMGVRHQVRELSSMFAAAGEPLKDAQAKALREAFAEVTRQQSAEAARATKPTTALAGRLGPNGELDPADQLELEEAHLRLQREHHERLRHAASAILSLSQMKQLEAQQEAQLKMHEAHLRMRRAQSDAEARGEVQALFTGDGVMVLSPSNSPPPR